MTNFANLLVHRPPILVEVETMAFAMLPMASSRVFLRFPEQNWPVVCWVDVPVGTKKSPAWWSMQLPLQVPDRSISRFCNLQEQWQWFHEIVRSCYINRIQHEFDASRLRFLDGHEIPDMDNQDEQIDHVEMRWITHATLQPGDAGWECHLYQPCEVSEDLLLKTRHACRVQDSITPNPDRSIENEIPDLWIRLPYCWNMLE